MKALATFIMRGRAQAVMAASVFLVLGLLVTPLGIFSAAVVGLITLRHGVREGGLVSLLGMLALGVLGYLLFGQSLALAVTGGLLWLPLMGMAEVLRVSRSLRLVVELAALLGLLVIGLQYLFMEDVNGFWKGVLGEYAAQLMDPAVISEAQRLAMVEEIAPWMAGGMAAAWFLQLLMALFLARGWQAMLYRPGGFANEFRELRLGYWLLILAAVLLLAGMVVDGPGFLAQCALVVMTAFFIQGVAVVHGVVNRLRGNAAWLIGFYFLLLIGMPASFTLISALGFADGLVNFRARVRARGPKPGDE